MSKHHTINVKCPECGHEIPFTIWDSVNVDLEPEAKEKIFNGDLFLCSCPECGIQLYYAYGFLYHDMSRKLMIYFLFNEPDEGKYDTSNLPAFCLDGYTLRVVYGHRRLVEKIMMFDSGLNDIAVERMKYMVSHFECPEIFRDGEEFYFCGWEPAEDPRRDKNIFGEIFFRKIDKNGNGEELTFEMESYYEHAKATEIDPRMKADKWECVDQGWMDMKLRRVEP